MLASPMFPSSFSSQHAPDEASQYKPAKDLEAFRSLLPPPIEFVEGSSSGMLAIPEGTYEPINVSPKAHRTSAGPSTSPMNVKHTKKSSSPTSPTSRNKLQHALYDGVLKTSWFPKSPVGAGMHNTGNTCFLNSALQCLLHTRPLLHILDAHGKADPCRVLTGFCMTCELAEVATRCHSTKAMFNPYQITSKLHLIAKHMRRGRQEDSHEFLRYAIDALQKSCLAGFPVKLDHKVAETTWVHKIFGGRLRSRVKCHQCEHNSDTFDSFLDLSLDIFGVSSLREALRKFVAIDHLKGADKYRCEKCNQHVVASKQFTLHDSPCVLTVHLKRFSPLGRKIGHHIRYDEHLSTQPFMSEGQFGPTYSLYGVICHAGGGPNSGHYYAFVKGRDGWYEMNDETVTYHPGPPIRLKSAYMLFYQRGPGQVLKAALSTPLTNGHMVPRLAMKKRRVVDSDEEDEEDEEDQGVKVASPIIGPNLPTPPSPSRDRSQESKRAKTSHDPQADIIKRKIEALTKSPSALEDLGQYESSGDEERHRPLVTSTQGESPPSSVTSSLPSRVSSPAPPLTSSPGQPALSPSPSPSKVPKNAYPPRSPISPNSFYGSTNIGRSGPALSRPSLHPQKWSRNQNMPPNTRPFNLSSSPAKRSYDPYTRLSRSNNLHNRPPPLNTYGRKRRTHT